PAVFAITRDTFIVYTSNACAIVGLRSLYCLLAKMMERFIYLKFWLSLVLAFVVMKMLLRSVVAIPVPISLAVIVSTLTVTMLISCQATHRRKARDSAP